MRCIFLFVALVASASAVSDVDYGTIKISGGRPLHQAEKIGRYKRDLYRKYSYIRCVNYQLVKHFGSDSYNETEKIFPADLAETLYLVKSKLSALTAQRESLLLHHDTLPEDNISFDEQHAVNQSQKHAGKIKERLDLVFDQISARRVTEGNVAICDKVLNR